MGLRLGLDQSRQAPMAVDWHVRPSLDGGLREKPARRRVSQSNARGTRHQGRDQSVQSATVPPELRVQGDSQSGAKGYHDLLAQPPVCPVPPHSADPDLQRTPRIHLKYALRA